MARKKIQRGPGQRWVEGKSFRLADEVRYIQDKAADHDSRVVSFGPLILFSSQSGDAWLLDSRDRLATRVARDGDPESVLLEETDANFAIGWKGTYRIDGAVFIYMDQQTRRVTTTLGYPTEAIAQQGAYANDTVPKKLKADR